jgi:1-deoxy-D-xylulose-5-phosphate synthase
MRVLNFGVKKQLYDRYDVDQLLTDNHLQDQQIADDIMQVVNSIK